MGSAGVPVRGGPPTNILNDKLDKHPYSSPVGGASLPLEEGTRRPSSFLNTILVRSVFSNLPLFFEFFHIKLQYLAHRIRISPQLHN